MKFCIEPGCILERHPGRSRCLPHHRAWDAASARARTAAKRATLPEPVPLPTPLSSGEAVTEISLAILAYASYASGYRHGRLDAAMGSTPGDPSLLHVRPHRRPQELLAEMRLVG